MFVVSLFMFSAMASGRAETPSDAFRRGMEDAQRLRDRLLGKKPDAGHQQRLEAEQAEVLRLYKSGELTLALERYEVLLGGIETAFGRKSREYSATLGIKAGILQDLGRFEPAIETYREAARITREVVGGTSTYYAQDLANLGDLLRVTDRLEDATTELREAARIAGQTSQGLGVRALALTGLGEVLRRQKRFDEAETALNEALRLAKRLDNLDLVAGAVSNRSLVHMDQGRLALALEKLDQQPPFLKERGLEATTLGLLVQSNRAGLMAALGRLDEAEALARANLALAERTFPNAAAWQAKLRAALGAVLVKAGKRDEARQQLEGALSTLSAPEHRLEDLVAPAAEEERFVKLYIAAFARLALDAPSSDAMAGDLRRLLFRFVEQYSPSASARALWQMSLRAAAGNKDVADIARRLQDVEGQFVAARRAQFALQGPLSSAEAQRLGKSIATLIRKRAELVEQIEARWPGYAALAGGDPTTIDETRALLRDDEALVRVVALPQPMPLFEDAYVWVLTKTASRLVPLSIDLRRIEADVATLRCGLDATSWWSKESACPTLTGADYSEADKTAGKPLPFDAARAHSLYMSLLGEAAALIKGKHLLIVPSGALTTLPFQVLVTEPPKSGDLKSVRWLARDHAITVLPSVASLKALRRTGKPSAAPNPMIGFGNPLLDGDQAHPQHGAYFKEQAQIARAQTGCAKSQQKRTASLRVVARSLAPLPVFGRTADLNHLRLQAPLPETADELCEVARSVGGIVEHLRIGSRATETEVKRLSSSGELAKYKILHFATHGTLAGQLKGTSEPGLILTPPKTATDEDDGYLSGSEISSLKLDADWVILSACNTAGGAGQGEAAEALSGLARVFFYAGARALLVSHWEVDSAAMVKLITTAMAELAKDKSIGRAEAMRRAMLAVMADTSRPANWVPAWHPSVWAPFVVVGEGGVGR